MEFTPIGILALVAAAFIVARPMSLGLPVIAGFAPLQAAAFANLPAVGGVSIICVHVLAGALVAGIAIRPRMLNGVIQFGARNSAIVLFGAFTAYAVLSAVLMPRLFEGETSVFSLARTTQGFISLSPLYPTTGNMTQSLYITINFLLFASATFAISRDGGLRRMTHMVNVLTIVHLIFALISMVPNAPPVAMLLDLIRTANYSINSHHVLAGAPRIIGSYTEPAMFGAMSVGLFGWNFTRFMQTRGIWLLLSSVLLLGCIALSLSTTAYAALVLLVGLWGLHSVFYLVRPGITSDQITAILFCVVVAVGFLLLFFVEPFRDFAALVYERLFGVKLQSASGVERGSWNTQSLQNFVDTKGFGVGLGSARASSLFAVLVGNVGFIGTIIYVAFLNKSYLRAWMRRLSPTMEKEIRFARRVFTASRAAAVGLLLTHLIAGTTVDGGVIAILFIAAATASFSKARKPQSVLGIGSPDAQPQFRLRVRDAFFNAGSVGEPATTTRREQARIADTDPHEGDFKGAET